MINSKRVKEPKMKYFDFAAFQKITITLSHDKIIFHMLYGAFHDTPYIWILPNDAVLIFNSSIFNYYFYSDRTKRSIEFSTNANESYIDKRKLWSKCIQLLCFVDGKIIFHMLCWHDTPCIWILPNDAHLSLIARYSIIIF